MILILVLLLGPVRGMQERMRLREVGQFRFCFVCNTQAGFQVCDTSKIVQDNE